MKPLAALLLLLAVAAPLRAQEVPEWFPESLLDLRAEVADAAKERKRLMLYFWLEGCPYCRRMTAVTFSDPQVAERLREGFVPLALNVRGDREVTWTDGAALSEKRLTEKLQVRGTPTLVFLDEKGAVALRSSGYLEPRQLLDVLERASLRAALPRSASPPGRRAPRWQVRQGRPPFPG